MSYIENFACNYFIFEQTLPRVFKVQDIVLDPVGKYDIILSRHTFQVISLELAVAVFLSNLNPIIDNGRGEASLLVGV